MIIWIMFNAVASLILLCTGVIFSMMVIDGPGEKPEAIVALVCLFVGIASFSGTVILYGTFLVSR